MNSEQLKKILHQQLAILEPYPNCVLLDYPNYLNIGDHLIWLGSVLYLTHRLKHKIAYVASSKSFSDELMEKKVDKIPIFFNGGGNLGDLWRDSQQFREYIISKYQDRPIVILPQSIYFKEQDNLQATAKIFNAHPNLTIFVRDAISYEIAIKSFDNCRIIQAPDMAFQLINSPHLSLINPPKMDSILYISRQDREANQDLKLDPKTINNITHLNVIEEDWVSYNNHWLLGLEKNPLLKQIIAIFREGWQRGLKTPNEWLSRQIWLSSHGYSQLFYTLPNFQLTSLSWNFVYSGMYQFKRHPLIITNRLHGHILAIILEIPHIFLPNAYYKNQSFYQAWTSEIPFCRFVDQVKQIPVALSELIND